MRPKYDILLCVNSKSIMTKINNVRSVQFTPTRVPTKKRKISVSIHNQRQTDKSVIVCILNDENKIIQTNGL